jgi:hypothetical protein
MVRVNNRPVAAGGAGRALLDALGGSAVALVVPAAALVLPALVAPAR